jgi:hypothetical protein
LRCSNADSDISKSVTLSGIGAGKGDRLQFVLAPLTPATAPSQLEMIAVSPAFVSARKSRPVP